jgi:hypothetical protein
VCQSRRQPICPGSAADRSDPAADSRGVVLDDKAVGVDTEAVAVNDEATGADIGVVDGVLVLIAVTKKSINIKCLFILAESELTLKRNDEGKILRRTKTAVNTEMP